MKNKKIPSKLQLLAQSNWQLTTPAAINRNTYAEMVAQFSTINQIEDCLIILNILISYNILKT